MRRPGLILAIICLPVFIGALDLTIISAVLPDVILDLNIPLQSGLDHAAWVVSGYLLAYAVSMTFMGRVSDLWGRQRVYLVCLAIFFVGSWLVAASPSWPADLAMRLARLLGERFPDRGLMALNAMIFGRVVQAFGAGAMVPVSMALVADLYPAERRALPLGLIGAVDTAGWVLGHLYGGIMVQFVAWPFLFWINLPVVAVLFGLTVWVFRGSPDIGQHTRIDWIGALLISAALVGINLGLGAGEPSAAGVQTADQAGFNWPVLFVGLLLLALFLLYERRAAHPLLDLRIFADRNVSAAGVINLLVGFCLMVGLVSVPLFINVAGQGTSGQGALVSGYLLSTFTVPLALAALPGGWLTPRLGYRATSLIGLGLAALGFAWMTRWQPGMAAQAIAFVEGNHAAETTADLVRMVGGLILAGIGLGLTIAPIGTAVINGVRDSERGIAAAVVIILRLIGMSVCVSALTTYGLQRTTAISRRLLEGVPLTDFARIAEAAVQSVTQVTTEMAWIALILCAVALAPALLLRRGG